jgi:hypothetical protein
MREFASQFASFHSLGRLGSEGRDTGHRRSPDNCRVLFGLRELRGEGCGRGALLCTRPNLAMSTA